MSGKHYSCGVQGLEGIEGIECAAFHQGLFLWGELVLRRFLGV